MDLLSVLEEGQHQEDEGFVSKPKGWREWKNLECSINFNARGNGLPGVKAGPFVGLGLL